jgi:hypothetical protein
MMSFRKKKSGVQQLQSSGSFRSFKKWAFLNGWEVTKRGIGRFWIDKHYKAKVHPNLPYSDFIIPMVKSIQELNTMLNDYAEISKQQQKKIDELQKEINTLKKRSKSN